MEEPIKGESERMAFIATGKAKDLPALMTDIEKLVMELIAVHDRPEKTELGHYHYLIECSGGGYKEMEVLAQKHAFEFRYLGSFEVKDE